MGHDPTKAYLIYIIFVSRRRRSSDHSVLMLSITFFFGEGSMPSVRLERHGRARPQAEARLILSLMLSAIASCLSWHRPVCLRWKASTVCLSVQCHSRASPLFQPHYEDHPL